MHNLHGLPGVFSGVASVVAAAVADVLEPGETLGRGRVNYGNSLFLVFPARAPSNSSELTPEQLLLGVSPGEGRHGGTQAGFQLALLVTTLAISLGGGLLTGKGSLGRKTLLYGALQCVCSSVGLLVNFLPAFNAIRNKSEYFDDKLYWEVSMERCSRPSLIQTREPVLIIFMTIKNFCGVH